MCMTIYFWQKAAMPIVCTNIISKYDFMYEQFQTRFWFLGQEIGGYPSV